MSDSKERKKYWKEYHQRLEVKERQRKYDQRPEVKKKRKEYNQRLEVKARRKKYAEEHKEYHLEYMKEYKKRPEVRKRLNELQREYRKKNKEKFNEYQNKWVKKFGRENLNKWMRDYRKLPQVKDRINKQVKKRHKEDPIFRLKQNLKSRFKTALNLYSKTGKIMKSKDYGINYKKIIEHLKPFPKDIENYEVDHIVPLSWFNFNNPKEIKWAFAPENHQWLLKEKNGSKSNRFMG